MTHVFRIIYDLSFNSMTKLSMTWRFFLNSLKVHIMIRNPYQTARVTLDFVVSHGIQ